MALSRKQRAMIVTGALCGAALVVDKVFFAPGPAAATASVTTTAATAATAMTATLGGTGAVVTDATPAQRGAVIAARLDRIAGERSLDVADARDAFRPAATWAAETRREGAVPLDDPAALFRGAHRLTGVMAGTAGRDIAIVDGVNLFVGQHLDGWTLMEVLEASARFESEAGEVVELRLARVE